MLTIVRGLSACVLIEEVYCVLTFGLQDHSCALSSGGGVSCWGYNSYGQVMPFVVCEDCCWLMLLGGGEGQRSLLLTTRCVFAQLGDGSTTHWPLPLAVVGLGSGMVAIALGDVGLFCVT